MTTRLAIIQAAQLRIGDEKITAETDPAAAALIAIFDDVLGDLISRIPWRFATVTRRLTRLNEAPPAYWKYYYQLPPDMIGAPRAVYDQPTQRQPTTSFEMTENRLATDALEVWLRHTKLPVLSYTPGYFLSLLTKACMREFCLTVREDKGLYQTLGDEIYGPASAGGIGGLLGMCANLDAQAGPSPAVGMGANPLADVRR